MQKNLSEMPLDSERLKGPPECQNMKIADFLQGINLELLEKNQDLRKRLVKQSDLGSMKVQATKELLKTWSTLTE